MTIVVYTDASYCNRKMVAACGYVLIIEGKMVKHTVVLAENVPTCTAAEFLSANLAIQEAYLHKGVTEIIIYTDCNTIITHRGGMGSRSKFMADELAETMEMLQEDGITLTKKHVKGHNNNFYNEKVDRSCRNELRKLTAKV